MKLELLKIKIEKEKLLKAPGPERAFYLKAMNFLTDVSIIQKCCWHSIPQKDNVGPIKESAASIQAMFFVRHLAGLLLEGYELIRVGFLTKRLEQSYCIKELKPIKKYFSKKGNSIRKIRDKFAYHLDIASVGNELEQFSDSEELAIYLAMEMSNSLYKAGDDILLSAIVRATNKRPRALLDEILLMATTFQTFFGEFVVMFQERYLGFEAASKITLDIPSISEVNIPYFAPRY